MSHQVRVWDLPTRLFHWALVLCIVGLITTAQLGGDAMIWHFRLGYTVLSLLIFRLCWGFVGGHWSRFSSFAYPPRIIWRYIQGKHTPELGMGHNPLGALSIFGMLAILLLQVGSGLFSDDEIANFGPLSKFAGESVVGLATYYHKNIGKIILVALIALHLGAIAYYALRQKNNLVKPMISGDKDTERPVPYSRDDLPSRRLALIIFLACAALVSSVVTLVS